MTEGVLSLLGSFELKDVRLPLHTGEKEEEEEEEEKEEKRLVEEGEETLTEEEMKVEVEEKEEEEEEESGAKEGIVYEGEVEKKTISEEEMFGIYNENDENKTNEGKTFSLNTVMVSITFAPKQTIYMYFPLSVSLSLY